MNFLMVGGMGDPNTSKEYKEAVEALFTVSYKAKFVIKKGGHQVDYAVMPLESLWWVENEKEFSFKDKSNWKWTAMIMQPEYVTQEVIEHAKSEALKKKFIAALSKLNFQGFKEGEAIQTLHIGPFSTEQATIDKLHKHMDVHGYHLSGKHHEIYLTYIRRAAPENWKTIIRLPVSK